MSRRRFLFAYDISDDRQRTDVFELLRDYGDHAQYSVFFCELSPREVADLCGRLATMINHATDQVMVLDLGSSENPLERDLRCIGKPFDPPGRTFIV